MERAGRLLELSSKDSPVKFRKSANQEHLFREILKSILSGCEWLVAVHGHSLRVAAQFSVGRGTDRSATARMASCSATLLQCKKLLGTERLIVDLACCFDEILKMGASQEVPQIHKLAMVLILHINDAPSVLAATNLLTIDNNGFLTTDDSEWNDVLRGG